MFVLVFFFAVKNITFLTFAVFLVFSAFEKEPLLSRINFSAKKPARGKEVKHIMLSENSTYRDALRHIDSGKYLIFQFYSGGVLDEITEDELFDDLQFHGLYDKIQN